MTGKSRGVAILLALFAGGIGGHRYYFGQVGAGLLYTLFFWTFIPAIIALFEAIGYMGMSNEAFNAKYNRAPE